MQTIYIILIENRDVTLENPVVGTYLSAEDAIEVFDAEWKELIGDTINEDDFEELEMVLEDLKQGENAYWRFPNDKTLWCVVQHLR